MARAGIGHPSIPRMTVAQPNGPQTNTQPARDRLTKALAKNALAKNALMTRDLRAGHKPGPTLWAVTRWSGTRRLRRWSRA